MVGAKSVVTLGNFVLDLQRVSHDSLTRAILVVRSLGRGLDPREVLLADVHHALGQRGHEQRLRDLGSQLLRAIVHFRLAHRGLRFSDAPCELGPSPQRQLLLDTVSEIAVFRCAETARAINAATEHRHRVIPSADRLGVERGRTHARVGGLERRIVRARFGDQAVDVGGRDDHRIRRCDELHILSSPSVHQAGARNQNSSKEFHGTDKYG